MTRRLLPAGLIAVLAVAACGPVEPPATLPQGLSLQSGLVTRDPVIVIGQDVGEFFRAPQPGQPAAAARAIAELEWLAATIPTNPRWQTANATALTALAQARFEARRALGIPQSAPAQPVINGLAGAAFAIADNDRAELTRALPRALFTLGPEGTVAALAAPPAVPSAMLAMAGLAPGPQPRPPRR
ncbi:hypothetical protein GWK16_10030 [Roseomonas sp. JC162]|uniref:Uncharacterized protein n=1 Tax=Neoroseomonas marina TaxID=1232220 RepID=A0A848EDI2_9PROT|nr:hypothetical protein [Neoroseomonas marina]NMJ41579.1 hypothetical protein [Neoroseomonas marina]